MGIARSVNFKSDIVSNLRTLIIAAIVRPTDTTTTAIYTAMYNTKLMIN